MTPTTSENFSLTCLAIGLITTLSLFVYQLVEYTTLLG